MNAMHELQLGKFANIFFHIFRFNETEVCFKLISQIVVFF